MIREHDDEPVRGLPERLPEGERVLWQGAPNWRGVARRVFLTRIVAIYFAAIGLWRGIDAAEKGAELGEIALAAMSIAPVAAVGLGLLYLLAWATAATTVYTITNRRVALRLGIALQIIVNVPHAKIAAARVKPTPGGGDIALAISGSDRFAYLTLWPHVRPWRLVRPEPSLRSVPDYEAAAAALKEGLLEAHPDGVATPTPTAPGAIADAPAHGAPAGKPTTRPGRVDAPPATAQPVGLTPAAR